LVQSFFSTMVWLGEFLAAALGFFEQLSGLIAKLQSLVA